MAEKSLELREKINDLLKKELANLQFTGTLPEVLVDDGASAYDRARQVFNRKFQFRPAAIVFCAYIEHVQAMVIIGATLNIEIRVRSGGHDHEGECSGTDVMVIDLSRMNKLSGSVDDEQGVVRVPPGAIFKMLIPILNEHNVSIPHGTCGTVGLPGFTFGGGWGPWTRQKGMCCESLVGATIVLGDGSVRKLDARHRDDHELLWALRGGGGMSYGIVTELVIKTFPLPPQTIKFNVEWEDVPAIDVLEHWENMIVNDQGPALLGTNLKIMAKPASESDSASIKKSVHQCVFYGYFAGEEAELRDYVEKWFGDIKSGTLFIDPNSFPDPKTGKVGNLSFSGWDRAEWVPPDEADGEDVAFLIPPDADEPAPHKITSRLAKKGLPGGGLGPEGRENLIRSLESNLLHAEGQKAGVRCYVTLGAITGPYYKKYRPDEVGSAFAYKERPYTIQYQAWWNESEKDIAAGKKHFVERYINQAEDWIEECREREFPQTLGSFISFKDTNVPTWKYFIESDTPGKEQEIYNRLKTIKEKHSKDPQNRFRTRKTIL